MIYTDEPVADYDRHCFEQQKQLETLPKCCECDKYIQSDECYEFEEGYICPDCLKDNHRKWVEDCVR